MTPEVDQTASYAVPSRASAMFRHRPLDLVSRRCTGMAVVWSRSGLGKGCFSIFIPCRLRDEACCGSKSKACREKMRRDRLNERFLELSSILDPGKLPKSDKAGILSDAARVLAQLKSEAEQLKEANKKLQETIKQLKVEKNELRDDKLGLKLEKEKLELQVKTTGTPTAGLMPPTIAVHPASGPAIYKAHGEAPAKEVAPLNAFPCLAMWQWLPPAFLDTTHDPKLWPPHA
ncbi:transcription factor ILR3 isoform X2 [Dendrobium catenatum]|uniref:transcription factor ILR3 isoform X2 n=1 Tax=Dendrobium catenatum TaxID=906689 RepID=UPI0009F54520|nr:transcription factor ILR3 isoform X2 [Dendrobium catenatum]